MRRSLAALATVALSSALAVVLACKPVEEGAPAKTDKTDKIEKADKAEVKEPAAKTEGVEARPADPAGAAAPDGSSPDDSSREGDPPSWYDETLFPGAKIMRKDRSETLLAGGYASAMVLELGEGTTPQQCMDSALAEIAKEMGKPVAELKAPEVAADRQVAHGNGSGYEYTVVCGVGKGNKPTLFLSYTRS